MRSLDLFSWKKIIAPDFFENTLPGAWLSISAAVVMGVLFVAELSSYLAVKVTSEVVMTSFSSHTPDSDHDLLRINFDITLPHVSCQYAAVDIDDVMGRRRENVTDHVMKWTIDHAGEMKDYVETTHPEPEFRHIEWDPNRVYSTMLTSENFESVTTETELTIINFFAPWCHWCTRLAPVWEHTAALAVGFQPKIKFAKVDCTDPKSEQLCMEQHVQAYPTIILFSSVHGIHTHEFYHGDRTPEAFLLAVAKLRDTTAGAGTGFLVRQLLRNEKLIPDDHEEPPIEPLGTTSHVLDNTPQAHPDGCRILGMLFVKRVPGAMTISVHSEHHSFDHSIINMAHNVNMLVFGDPLDENAKARLGEKELEMMNITHEFYSDDQHTQHEHYIDIVNTLFKFSNGDAVNAFKFSMNSNEVIDTTRRPGIKFTYHISPMSVIITESRMPFYHFITNVCAIIGGMYTIFSLLDTIVYQGSKIIKKKTNLGKQG